MKSVIFVLISLQSLWLYGKDIDGLDIARGEGIVVGPIPDSNMFSGAPYTPGEAQPLDAVDAPEVYTVEYGDTLIDICDQLLGKPGYWPRLWSLNPFIKNPHFVWPGMRLRFYPGSDELPPYLEVLEDDDIVFIEDDVEDHQLLDIDIPEWQPFAPGQAELIGIENVPAIASERFVYSGPVLGDVPDIVTQPILVVPQSLSELGKIRTVGEGSVRYGRVVSVALGQDTELEKTYVIIRPAEKLSSTGRIFYRYVAQVQLVKYENGQAWGRLRERYLKVAVDDLVIPFRNMKTRAPRFVDGEKSVQPSSSGQIIAFASKGRKIGHSYNFVAIDVGTDHGVQKGNLLDVHRLVKDRLKFIGQLYVTEASLKGAVALVRPGAIEVLQGDKIVGAQIALNSNNL